MIDALIRWSLNDRALVLVLAGAMLAWGGYLLATMPVEVLPDLTAPTVTILAEGRAMAPTEMESLVTFPIEGALNGASGVRRVRSATACRRCAVGRLNHRIHHAVRHRYAERHHAGLAHQAPDC